MPEPPPAQPTPRQRVGRAPSVSVVMPILDEEKHLADDLGATDAHARVSEDGRAATVTVPVPVTEDSAAAASAKSSSPGSATTRAAPEAPMGTTTRAVMTMAALSPPSPGTCLPVSYTLLLLLRPVTVPLTLISLSP